MDHGQYGNGFPDGLSPVRPSGRISREHSYMDCGAEEKEQRHAVPAPVFDKHAEFREPEDS